MFLFIYRLAECHTAVYTGLLIFSVTTRFPFPFMYCVIIVLTFPTILSCLGPSLVQVRHR